MWMSDVEMKTWMRSAAASVAYRLGGTVDVGG